MSRCHRNTYGQCACKASGVSCRVAPAAITILNEANKKAATHDALCLVLLAFFVFAIIFGLGTHAGPINV
jgi:hypothetical protein